jgi:hypothetical protein
MKKVQNLKRFLLVFVVSVSFNLEALSWGNTGHRAVAEIANQHISKSTKKKIEALLGDSYLPLYGTYADDVRSERDNPLSRVPHYVNMPFEETYSSAEKNENGDLVTVMNDMIRTLKDQNSSKEEKAVALKFIIHFVADAHQPMHVGLAEDLGGNRVDVKWFNKSTNLHRVWDSDIINSINLSYTELARFADSPKPENLEELQNISVVDWIDETHQYTKLIYDNLGDREYSYDYFHKFSPLVMQQIQKAGYRLAYMLNDLMQDVKLKDLK